jgi:hypothetical protein
MCTLRGWAGEDAEGSSVGWHEGGRSRNVRGKSQPQRMPASHHHIVAGQVTYSFLNHKIMLPSLLASLVCGAYFGKFSMLLNVQSEIS